MFNLNQVWCLPVEYQLGSKVSRRLLYLLSRSDPSVKSIQNNTTRCESRLKWSIPGDNLLCGVSAGNV